MSENSILHVQAETFRCPSCGGSLQYEHKKEKVLCASCGYEGTLHAGDNTVDESNFSGYAQRERESIPFPGVAVTSCQSCGAQITFAAQTTATTCPMCGSAQILEMKQRAGIPPEGIIPFKVDKQEAGLKFRDWVKGLWFAPSKLKQSYQAGNLMGRFVPFWTYDAQSHAAYTGQGGRHRTVKYRDGKEHI